MGLEQLDIDRPRLLEERRVLEGQLARVMLNRRDFDQQQEALLDRLADIERDLVASGIHYGDSERLV